MNTFLITKLKQLKNIKISGERLFFIAFTMSLIASFIINTTFMDYFHINYVNWINYAAFFLILIKIYIFDDFDYKKYICLTVVLGLAVISWKKTQVTTVMMMFAFILGAKGINFNKIIKNYFHINLMLLLLVIVYSLAGIIKNFIFFRGEIYRYGLGIDYPTDLSAYVFYLCLAYCYLNSQKMNYKKWLGIFIVDIIMYLITNTRVDTFLIILIFPLILLVNNPYKNKIQKFLASSFWYLNIIFPYIFVLMTLYFSLRNSILVKINQILSGRLIYGHQGLIKYGMTLFGRKIVEHGWGGAKGLTLMKNNPSNYFFIDSSFVRFIIINGMLIGIIAFIILVYISIRETIKGDYLLPAILFLVVLSSLIDQHFLELTYNPFLLSFLSVIPLEIRGGLRNGKIQENYNR